jgi:hypothetical protein
MFINFKKYFYLTPDKSKTCKSERMPVLFITDIIAEQLPTFLNQLCLKFCASISQLFEI